MTVPAAAIGAPVKAAGPAQPPEPFRELTPRMMEPDRRIAARDPRCLGKRPWFHAAKLNGLDDGAESWIDAVQRGHYAPADSTRRCRSVVST